MMRAMSEAGMSVLVFMVSMGIAIAVEIPMERISKDELGKGGTPVKRAWHSVAEPAALSEKPGEKLLKEPEYLGIPRYATLRLGNGKDDRITVVLDETDSEVRVYVDANNDEDLTNDGARRCHGQSSRKKKDGTYDYLVKQASAKVSVNYRKDDGEFALPYWLTMYRYLESDDPENLQNLYYASDTALRGMMVVGGKSYPVALVEPTADGLFVDMLDEPVDKRIAGLMVDFNGNGMIDRDRRLPEQVGEAGTCDVSAPFLLGGKSWVITKIAPSGRTITVEESTVAATPPVWPDLPRVDIGDPAPLFSAKDIDGKMLDLKELRGKVVLLDFWATWCGPCVGEIPTLLKVWEKYKDRDFIILSISLDGTSSMLNCSLKGSDPLVQKQNQELACGLKNMTPEERKKVEDRALDGFRNYVREKGMTWRHICENKDCMDTDTIADAYDVRSIPRLFLLDRKGTIVEKELRGSKLEPAVKKAVEDKG